MQVAQIGAASPPLMCCPSLPRPCPMTIGKADAVRVNEVFLDWSRRTSDARRGGLVAARQDWVLRCHETAML
jgi:hypothetical protein